MKNKLLKLLGIIILFTSDKKETLAAGIKNFLPEVIKPKDLANTSQLNAPPETVVSQIISYLINLIIFASGSISIILLILGGIRYISSLGDQEALDSAKKIIKQALIGLLVIIFSYFIVNNVVKLIFESTI